MPSKMHVIILYDKFHNYPFFIPLFQYIFILHCLLKLPKPESLAREIKARKFVNQFTQIFCLGAATVFHLLNSKSFLSVSKFYLFQKNVYRSLPKKLGTQKKLFHLTGGIALNRQIYLNTINLILIFKKIAEKLPHYKFE